VSLPVLASEAIDKTLWYPTILGALVVVFAIGLFCGSLYLLLATNLGARLGFLVAFTALTGFMVILTSMWITTASPLNTLKGRIPSWEPREILSDVSESKIEVVRTIVEQGKLIPSVEAANVKAAADETLVAVEALPGESQTAEQKAIQAKYGRFSEVTQYLAVATYETGGSKPNPFDFELSHKPLYAVVQFCEVVTPDVPFGVAPPETECMTDSSNNGVLVLERDLGSIRIPPIVAWISSILLFGLGLLGLHWRERDEQEATKRAESASAPAPAPRAAPG
jgi:hypothetical protein